MNKGLQVICAASVIVLASTSWADHNSNRHSAEGRYDDHYHWAKVVDAKPIFEVVRVPRSREVCEERVVRRRVAEHRSAGPAIFGAILGGVIGNQLSRGHGHGHHGDRAAATITGAAIGGVVGSEIQHSKHPARYYSEHVPVCGVRTSWRSERQVVAWDVSWKYQGRIYHSRMNERPGKRIRVRVDVNPTHR